MIKGERLFWLALGLGAGIFLGAAFGDWGLAKLADDGMHLDIIATGIGGFGGVVVTIGGAALIEERKAWRRARPHGMLLADIALDVEVVLRAIRRDADSYTADTILELGPAIFARAFEEIASVTQIVELRDMVVDAITKHGLEVPDAMPSLLALRTALQSLNSTIKMTGFTLANSARRGSLSTYWPEIWARLSNEIDSAIASVAALRAALANRDR